MLSTLGVTHYPIVPLALNLRFPLQVAIIFANVIRKHAAKRRLWYVAPRKLTRNVQTWGENSRSPPSLRGTFDSVSNWSNLTHLNRHFPVLFGTLEMWIEIAVSPKRLWKQICYPPHETFFVKTSFIFLVNKMLEKNVIPPKICQKMLLDPSRKKWALRAQFRD